MTVGIRSTAQNSGSDLQVWGGEHVELRLKHNGGELTFDCANGRFDEILKADRQGRFTVRGVYTPEHHGPVRDDINLSRPVVYAGTIHKNDMTLEIHQEGAPVQTYSLIKGRDGALTRCQ